MVGRAPASRQVKGEHALVRTKEIAEHRAHALQGVTSVRNENRSRDVEAARAKERHRFHDDVTGVHLKVTTALVTLDMRRTPDIDRVEPMRAQECARVVNRHHRNHLTAERSDVFDYVESTGQRGRESLGHVGSVPQFIICRRHAPLLS